MRYLVLLPGAVCFVSLLACGGGVKPEAEATARVSNAVGNGASTGASFPFVAELNMSGDASQNFQGSCSGTLVAPSWVLTANHCITGDSPTSSGSDLSWDASLWQETISVGFASSVATDGHCTSTGGTCFMHNGPTHTGFSLPVLVRMKHQVDMTSSSDYDNDIALVQLDSPVPPSIARPAAIAGLKPNVPSCPSSFTGTLVGYGPRLGVPIDVFGTKLVNAALTDRNEATSSGWGRSANDNNTTWSYTNSWGPWEVGGVITAYSGYQGVEPGDSGGPLMLNDGATPFGNFGGGIVCGVNSHFGVGGAPPIYATATTAEAGVDAAQNIGWLRQNLLVPGTNRITGLCLDDQDPSSEPPRLELSILAAAAQMPACAPAGTPPGYLNTYKFRQPSVLAGCAPGEPTQVTGLVTQVDGVDQGLDSVPIAANGMTTMFELLRARSSYTIVWTATDAAGATASQTFTLGCRNLPGDLNGDQRADIVAAGATASTFIGGHVVQLGITPVALSNGDGTFTVPTPSSVGSGGAQIVSGNFMGVNGTSFPGDVLGLNANGRIFISRSLGNGTFASELESTTVFGPFVNESSAQLLAGDFNGDMITDFVATGTPYWQTVPMALSNDDGTFSVHNQGGVAGNMLFAVFAAQSQAKTVSGDFDGDGLDDLAATGGAHWGSVPVAFSQGDGTFVTTNKASGFQTYSSGAGILVLSGDFNGDGLSDILALNLDSPNGTSPMPIALSNGDGTFTVVSQATSGNNLLAAVAGQPNAKIVVGDFNGDGLDDVAATGGDGWGTLPVAFSTGSGAFTTLNLPSTFQQYSSQPSVRVFSSWK